MVKHDADSFSRFPAQSCRNVCPVLCIKFAVSFSHLQWVEQAYSHKAGLARPFTFDRKEGGIPFLRMVQKESIPPVWKLLEEDATTYQEHLGIYWAKMLQRIRNILNLLKKDVTTY